MGSVEISIYAVSTELTEYDCIDLYLEIKDELEKKILEFNGTKDENILNKCAELDNYLNAKRLSYKKCDKYDVAKYTLNIENDIKNLLGKSAKYPKCSTKTIPDSESDKLNSETNQLCKSNQACENALDPLVKTEVESNCSEESSKKKCLLQENVTGDPKSSYTVIPGETGTQRDNSFIPGTPETSHSAVTALDTTTDDGIVALSGTHLHGGGNHNSDIKDNNDPYILSNINPYGEVLTYVKQNFNNYSEYTVVGNEAMELTEIQLLHKTPESTNIIRSRKSSSRQTSQDTGDSQISEVTHDSQTSEVTHDSQTSEVTERTTNQSTPRQSISTVPEVFPQDNHVQPAQKQSFYGQDRLEREFPNDPEGLTDLSIHANEESQFSEENLPNQENIDKGTKSALLGEVLTYSNLNNEDTSHSKSIQGSDNTVTISDEINKVDSDTESEDKSIISEGTFFDIFNVNFAEIPLTTYIKFVTTFLGSILLFMFLLKVK
ncbi:hypothetical protein PVC01_000026800 [Plasmodium vivax]|uniref:VIR protein n=1 Tax=Plasmodium vivax TaxID=5855 RepID=A0A1G4EBX5_PLAVI|nr:hypothetical protein PVC01_000026800 [Plasmodium vivax]